MSSKAQSAHSHGLCYVLHRLVSMSPCFLLQQDAWTLRNALLYLLANIRLKEVLYRQSDVFRLV